MNILGRLCRFTGFGDGGFVPNGKPRIRWFIGGWWICQAPGTQLGRGGSPAEAYHNWRRKL